MIFSVFLFIGHLLCHRLLCIKLISRLVISLSKFNLIYASESYGFAEKYCFLTKELSSSRYSILLTGELSFDKEFTFELKEIFFYHFIRSPSKDFKEYGVRFPNFLRSLRFR